MALSKIIRKLAEYNVRRKHVCFPSPDMERIAEALINMARQDDSGDGERVDESCKMEGASTVRMQKSSQQK